MAHEKIVALAVKCGDSASRELRILMGNNRQTQTMVIIEQEFRLLMSIDKRQSDTVVVMYQE
jgi:hypothetical protein